MCACVCVGVFSCIREQGYPRAYEVTAGEFKVVQSLMMASIPYLTGWNTSLEHGIESAVYEAKNQSGNDSRNSNVPF